MDELFMRWRAQILVLMVQGPGAAWSGFERGRRSQGAGYLTIVLDHVRLIKQILSGEYPWMSTKCDDTNWM